MATATTEVPRQAAGLGQNAEPAATVAEATGGRGSVLEPKFDGWRLHARVDEDGVRLYTRTGNAVTVMRGVEEELRAAFPPGTWLDGEAVAFGITDDGRVAHDHGAVAQALGGNGNPRRAEALTFVVFDLLYHGGIDARGQTLRDRRSLLEIVFGRERFEKVILSPQMEATEENHAAHLAAGFEGSVVKRLDSRYASGRRGFGWYKLKSRDTAEGVVMGFKNGSGSRAGKAGTYILGQHDAEGRLVQVAKCKILDAEVAAIEADPEALLGEVVEFGYLTRMPSGAYRHPYFIRFRDDKPAREVVTDAAA
jgi:ATP-dependent DNA ligase